MAPDKRTILITGCSDGGLGAYLAIAFHNHGWRVFASARNLNKVKDVTAAGLETVQLDVLSEESIATAVSHVSSLTGGSLDMLLNNAGAGYSMPTLDLEWAKLKDLFELNVFSVVRVTKAFLPLLRASQTVHGGVRGGIVVNNTSVSSLWVGATPLNGGYNATKGAATQLTETMRHELALFGIKVVNLLTGTVKTNFFDNMGVQNIPTNSIFDAARAPAEKIQSGEFIFKNYAEPEDYAKNVASQLSSSNPPYWVFAGKNATSGRLAMYLPIGWADGVLKKFSGLDEVERELKAHRKAHA